MREHIADFWAYNDLLDKATVPDPNRHFNYRWDDEKVSIGGKALDILKGKSPLQQDGDPERALTVV